MGKHVDRRDIGGDHDDSILKEKAKKVSFCLNRESTVLLWGLITPPGTYPCLPLRTALTVSLTPRWISLSFMPFLTSLINFLLILSLASGSAIGETNRRFSVAIFKVLVDCLCSVCLRSGGHSLM